MQRTLPSVRVPGSVTARGSVPSTHGAAGQSITAAVPLFLCHQPPPPPHASPCGQQRVFCPAAPPLTAQRGSVVLGGGGSSLSLLFTCLHPVAARRPIAEWQPVMRIGCSFIFITEVRVTVSCQSPAHSVVFQSCTHRRGCFSCSFHCGSLQGIEDGSLSCAEGTCCLSILYTVISICTSPAPNLSLPIPFPPGHHKFGV